MDNFVALLAMLMQPVLHRERFLVPVLQYYEGENAWNMITDDGEVVRFEALYFIPFIPIFTLEG